jgi:hypothetical protein
MSDETHRGQQSNWLPFIRTSNNKVIFFQLLALSAQDTIVL